MSTQQELLTAKRLASLLSSGKVDYLYPDNGDTSYTASYLKRQAVIADFSDVPLKDIEEMRSILVDFLRIDPNASAKVFDPTNSNVNTFGFEIKSRNNSGNKCSGFLFVCGDDNFKQLQARNLLPNKEQHPAVVRG